MAHHRFLEAAVLVVVAVCLTATGLATASQEVGSGILATSVRDFTLGIWVPNIPIDLYKGHADGHNWHLIAQNVTNASGKVPVVVSDAAFPPGFYRLIFHTSNYFASNNLSTFYPYAEVQFHKIDSDQGVTMLVPLLVSQYGYTSYRGSLA